MGNRHFRTWATVADRSATCPGRAFHFPVSQLDLHWYVTQADDAGAPTYFRLEFGPDGSRTR